MRYALISAALAASATALALVGCSSAPPPITAHGSVEDCTNALSAGSQVTVVNDSGTVIGSGTLADDNSSSAQAQEQAYDALNLQPVNLDDPTATSPSMGIYTFTVANLPGGEPRYGVATGSGHGTLWYSSAQMVSGPSINLGC